MQNPLQKTRFRLPRLRTNLTVDVPIGTVIGQENVRIALNETQLRSHIAIFGGTRKGKSKLLEMMLRVLVCSPRAGFCLLDPHGDLCDELLGYLGLNWDEVPPLKRRQLFYLNPDERTLCFDPFCYEAPRDLKGRDEEAYYRAWLEATVDRTAEIVLRAHGEFSFDDKARLEKYLKAVLYAVGLRGTNGEPHLPLALAPILLYPKHERYREVLAKVVARRLPFVVEEVLLRISEAQGGKFEDVVGSTESRLNKLLRSITRDAFSGQCPPINLRQVVRSNGILLCNLRDTEIFSRPPADALGGLLISQLINIAKSARPEERRPFYLIIDEAHRFIGQDILDTLGQSSKWGLFFVIAVQDLSAVRNEKVDMLPKLLSQCNVKLTFQQQHIPDARALAETFYYPNLDFTKLTQKQQFHDGYEIIETSSVSDGTSSDAGNTWASSKNWSEAASRSEGNGTSESESDEDSVSSSTSESGSTAVNNQDTSGESLSRGTESSASKGRSTTEGASESQGSSDTRAITNAKFQGASENEGISDQFPQDVIGIFRPPASGRSSGKAQSQGESDAVSDAHTESFAKGVSKQIGDSSSRTEGTNEARTASTSKSKGETDSTGWAKQATTGKSRGKTKGKSYILTIGTSKSSGGDESEGRSESQGKSHSESKNEVPLAKFRIEEVETGQLRTTIEDQLVLATQTLRTLRSREVAITTDDGVHDGSLRNPFTFTARVDYVPDAFDGLPEVYKQVVLRKTKETLYAQHPCYLPPERSLSDPTNEILLLDRWLRDESLVDLPVLNSAAAGAANSEVVPTGHPGLDGSDIPGHLQTDF